MLKAYSRLLEQLMLACDLLLVAGCWLLAYGIRFYVIVPPITVPAWSRIAAPTQRTPASFSSSSSANRDRRTRASCDFSREDEVIVRGVRPRRPTRVRYASSSEGEN